MSLHPIFGSVLGVIARLGIAGPVAHNQAKNIFDQVGGERHE